MLDRVSGWNRCTGLSCDGGASRVSCLNHGCILEKPSGIGTNGRCTCLDGLSTGKRLAVERRIRSLEREIEELDCEIENLAADLSGEPRPNPDGRF